MSPDRSDEIGGEAMVEAPEIRKLVLLPRLTALVGARTFTTSPISVRGVGSALVTVYCGPALGASPTFTAIVQQSTDLSTWTDVATISPSSDSESTAEAGFTMGWMRLAVTLGGTDPAMNCWAVANLVMRVGGRS